MMALLWKMRWMAKLSLWKSSIIVKASAGLFRRSGASYGCAGRVKLSVSSAVELTNWC